MADFKQFFTANLCANLQYDGFDLKVSHGVNQEYSDIGIAKTAKKSILSSMTDIALRLKRHIEYEGGLERADIFRLNQRINKTPMKSIGGYPIEALERVLGNPPRRLRMPERVTIGELKRGCPGVSYPTLQRAFSDLRKERKLRRLGRGPDAQWERISG